MATCDEVNLEHVLCYEQGAEYYTREWLAQVTLDVQLCPCCHAAVNIVVTLPGGTVRQIAEAHSVPEAAALQAFFQSRLPQPQYAQLVSRLTSAIVNHLPPEPPLEIQLARERGDQATRPWPADDPMEAIVDSASPGTEFRHRIGPEGSILTGTTAGPDDAVH